MSDGWPSTRKRLVMNLAWFAALVAFGATLAAVLLYNPSATTANELLRLKNGMTFDEVKAILGEPKVSVRASVVQGDPETVWTYSLPASHWSVTEADYQLRFYNGELETWFPVD